MRSEFADKFNHDEDAPEYDLDVQNEADPIRAGYRELIDWVGERAQLDESSVVLDLGAGTGNLSLRLAPCRSLVCVDISAEMSALGKQKMAVRHEVSWVQADLLEYVERSATRFDCIASTYAIHHLTDDEKTRLFARMRSALAPSGRLVFGDLMFADAVARADLLAAYRRAGRSALADDIEDEFFWDVSHALSALQALGFRTETRRISELSWGVAAYS